ncbi:DUF305 domain-containing protein [Microbacterium oryzae]|uniref:DUF305 domain-containing protein n=1 Tax=Microbacterium oryzae TaxID=743009 RepID=A0A6I6E0K8_9MICO|nr:DUF305 domain-containing protein [Microbacterium oryzae]QGU27674.1 DUF305 domain-containing protein [Microbacterium oryzae]
MKFRTITLSAGVLATALILAGCSDTGGSDMEGMDHGGSTASGLPTPSTEASDAVFNDADVTFAMEMVMHHQQAIEMSDTLLAKDGVHPDVVALAERIKAAQGPEIDTMNQWLEAWGQDADMGGMDHGGGMMSEEDMTALDEADGETASALFLEQMTMHHQGAIKMAQAEVDNGQNPEAVALAEKITAGQTAEIAEMQELLTQL